MTTLASEEAAAPTMRNVWLLTASFSLLGAGPLFNVTLGGLAGDFLLGPDKSLATLPVAVFNIGMAAFAIPAAWWSARVGRRRGLLSGTVIAAVATLAAAGAIALGSFWLFVFAGFVLGFSGSFSNQHRFAAAEVAPPALRGIAISRVMLGGLITAIFAPTVVLVSRDLFSPSVPFAGGYVAFAGVAMLSAIVLLQLRIPAAPAILANADPGVVARPLGTIIRQPRFLVAIACAAASSAMMSLVMTGAPLAMVEHHHSEANAVLGIQWHVLAMFAPSLFTGRLIARFGRERVAATGLGLLLVSALIGLAGVELLHFWAVLIVLGLGWNFGFIGGTAMLTETYRPTERARVEGFNDFVVFGAAALASFFSGSVLSSSGWDGLNIIVLPIAGAVLLLLLGFMVGTRRTA